MTARISLQMAKANLLRMLRDRRALLMLFVMPVVLIAILGSAFSGIFGSKSIPKFTVAVVNQDAGQSGAQLVSYLKTQKKQMTVSNLSSTAAAQTAVKSGLEDVIIIIPRDFSADLSENQKVQVQVQAPLNRDTEKSVTQSMITAYGQQLAVGTYLGKQIGGVHQAIHPVAADIQQKDPGMRPIGAGAYYAIGMMVMFMLTNAINRSANMVELKGSDLYKRMIAAPASRYALSLGNWTANFLVLFVQGVILLLAARWLLSIHFGPVLQTGLLLIGYAFSLSGISTALGAWFENQQLISGIANIGSQVAAVLGGSIWPIYNFPKIMQGIAHVLPNGIAVTTMVDSVMGIGYRSLLVPLIYLVGIGLALGLLAGVRYGRRLV